MSEKKVVLEMEHQEKNLFDSEEPTAYSAVCTGKKALSSFFESHLSFIYYIIFSKNNLYVTELYSVILPHKKSSGMSNTFFFCSFEKRSTNFKKN